MRISFENINPTQESFFNVSYHNQNNPCEVFWHYHPECELVFVPYGSSKRMVGEHSSHYTDGDLVLIAPNVPHLNFNYQQRPDHEEIVVQFQLDKLISSINCFPEFSRLTGWLGKINTGVCFGPDTRHQLNKDIYKLTKVHPVARTLLFLKILHKLSNAPDTEYLDQPGKGVHYNLNDGHRMNKVYSFVKDNYHKSIDIQKVVDLTNLSQAAFCRFFRKATKMSFTEFLNDYRVQKACEQITRGTSISEAAFSSGFNSLSHFNVVFKKIMNTSPSEYKKNKDDKLS
jgi:AraC-like DNA-binding protein